MSSLRRTKARLTRSDEGIALYRKLLLAEIEKVERGEDPLGVVRAEHDVIELPQERKKFGPGFLAESMEMGHARYSPIKDQVRALL